MSVYWEATKKRWRFTFNRKIRGYRYRSTKLLPQGWSQRQAEKYDQAESNRLYALATGVEKPRLSLAGAVQLYLDHRIPQLRDGRKAAQELAFLFDDISGGALEDVSGIAARYAEAQAGVLAPATVRKRLARLKAACRYAFKKKGYGDRDYTDGMDLPIADNQRQFYARLPELTRLWGKFEDAEARALFKLDFYMGLRWRAELLTREREHITRNGRDVWLEIGRTKNGEPVMKFVHPAVRSLLKFIPFAHGDSWYYDRWHKAVAAISRPELKPHDLRHSLASEIMARPGGNLDHVRAALHHKSLQAAQRYAHRYPETAKAILGATGVRENAHRRSLHRSRKTGSVKRK